MGAAVNHRRPAALAPSTFQGQDQLDLFRPAVKWGGPIFEWARIPEVLRLAFREMHNGRPGPVHVELPAPILYEAGDPRTAPVWAPEAYRVGPPQPSGHQLDEAAALLAAAERPVVIAGSGVDRAGAQGAVLEIAELLGCPAITTMAGRASVPTDHPNYVFGFGPAGDLARTEADVLLVAGSRMGNLDVPYDTYWGDAEGKRLIQIDIDPSDFGVTRPLHLGIPADALAALSGIAARLRATDVGTRDGADLARYRQLDEPIRMQLAAPILQWQGAGIHPAHALGAIGAMFGSDAIYTVDGGNTSLWAYNMLPPTRPGSYHSILELGMLGTGIPSAIGAKLGAPHLLYGTTFGTAQGEIRWDLVAQGLGCLGEYVERIEDLDGALRRSREHDGPSLVCVRTDHDANLSVPAELMARFFEVYFGPAKPTTV